MTGHSGDFNFPRVRVKRECNRSPSKGTVRMMKMKVLTRMIMKKMAVMVVVVTMRMVMTTTRPKQNLSQMMMLQNPQQTQLTLNT